MLRALEAEYEMLGIRAPIQQVTARNYRRLKSAQRKTIDQRILFLLHVVDMQSTGSVDVPEVCKQAAIMGDTATYRVPVLFDQIVQVPSSDIDGGRLQELLVFVGQDVEWTHVLDVDGVIDGGVDGVVGGVGAPRGPRLGGV